MNYTLKNYFQERERERERAAGQEQSCSPNHLLG